MQRLIPEWYPQEAIILAWPDSQTDWQPWLDSVRQTYLELIAVISNNKCAVVLLIRANEIANAKLLIGNTKQSSICASRL